MRVRAKAARVSGMDYLHERAAESRHSETLAYLMFMAGAIFFVGGLLETVVTIENPDWLLIFPYKLTPHAYSLLGLSLVLSGFTLLVLGIILGIHCTLKRVMYMDQLKEAYANTKNRELKIPAIGRKTRRLAKQPSPRKTMELEQCWKYLMNHMGIPEDDAIYYCKALGRHWCELVKE